MSFPMTYPLKQEKSQRDEAKISAADAFEPVSSSSFIVTEQSE